MIELDLEELVWAVDGKILSQVNTHFRGWGTDTRQDLTQKLFIALRGEAFDAHDFLDKSLEQGAAVLMVDKEKSAERVKPHVSVVLVGDTLLALQKLGHFWRKKMKAKIIGITGSNGKTSTKEFTATLLKQKFKVCYSQGSFNNHWGVPMSLMNLSPDDDVAVIEMGMNHLGEIKELCKIAEPDCVLITNIGSSHVGEVGGLENIVKAKEEIFKHSPGAIKIFNLDSPSIYKMFLNYKSSGPYFCFSKKDASADVHLEVINANAESLELRGIISRQQIQAVVPVFGSHNVENLMAACGVALALEMIPQEIQQGLGECKTIWGRNQFLKLKSGTTILFDAYNANPESMDQLLKNVDQLKIIGKKWAVIGEMLELGEESEIQHRELAQKMKRQNWAGVWFIGQNQEVFRESLKGAKFEKNLYLSSTYEEKLASLVQNMLNPNDMVVFKGSRGHKLEQILRAWEPGII